jgi:hypothetical protein
VLAALLGAGVVAFVIYHSGPGEVWAALVRAPLLFPIVVLLEAVLVGTETWCTYLLYGKEKQKVPFREVIRTTLFCYSLIAVLPFGRAAGEAARAAMLSKYVGIPRAAATATQVQGFTLLGNAVLSIPCLIAAWILVGPGWLVVAIIGNFIVTGALGGGVLLAARHTKLGTRIARFFPGGGEWGPEVDTHLRGELKILPPLGAVMLSRAALTAQRGVLLLAVGGISGVLHSLVSAGIYMVSGAIGDAIPAQVGVTEAGYAVAAQVLALTKGDAVAMALLAHIAQLVWVAIGFLAPLVFGPPAGAPGDEPPPPPSIPSSEQGPIGSVATREWVPPR